MEQYISKSAIIAELDDMLKTKEQTSHLNNEAFNSGRWKALKKIKDFLDTLEVKDANEALRTEYEKGRADVIAKTLEWINVFNDNNYIMQYSDSCEHPINEIIEWYNNYINRE